MKNANSLKTILGIVTGAVALALLFVAFVYPEIPSAAYVFSALLLICLASLVWLNHKALKEAMKTRNVRYGANAAITVALVLSILAVVNIMNFNHFYRKDLTKNQKHSLSDQTMKLLTGLKSEVKITAFTKVQNRDEVKNLVDNYIYIAGSKLKAEYVDPDRDPARAKAANIKKYGTVIIEADKKETRVDDVNEEKLTNGLIKILKDKNVTICFLTGHGEKNIEGTDAESMNSVKQELVSQTYEVKSVNLLEETKVPDTCTVLAIIGPNKAFFDKEVTALKNWLDAGGHALFALDPNVKGGGSDFHPEMTKLLDDWSIHFENNLILDPTSKMLGVNASVPIVGQYNKDHAITKEFQVTTLFPLASSIEIKASTPVSLKTSWLAKSTPRSFAKSNFKEIATGQVKLDPKVDKEGSHTLMVAVEGSRDSGPDKKQARIVAFGTSNTASNGYARHGANIDLFLNSISWLANDENLISIRPKEDNSQAVSLSQTESRYVQLLTMILVPGSVIIMGIFVWLRRRKL